MQLDSRDKVFLTLAIIENMTYLQKSRLIDLFEGDYDGMWKKFNRKHYAVVNALGAEKYSYLEGFFSEAAFERAVTLLEKSEISFVNPFDGKYPNKLHNIQNPPLTLFYKGDISLLNKLSVCISGSRKHSGYGRKVAERFAEELVYGGFTILGGLSAGIETIAHSKALSCGGKTVAVMSAGFFNIHPVENTNLFNRIAEEGLVVGEYAPSTRLNPIYFEQRNRLLAGLTDCAIFVEAGEKSGVFSIFEYALEFGREIFVVPGEIFSPYSAGTNGMIKSYASLLATSPEDVINCFKTVYKPKKEKYNIKLNAEETFVARLLLEDSLTFNEIVAKTGLSASDLGYILSCMELTGIVRKEASFYKLNTEAIDEISNS